MSVSAADDTASMMQQAMNMMQQQPDLVAKAQEMMASCAGSTLHPDSDVLIPCVCKCTHINLNTQCMYILTATHRMPPETQQRMAAMAADMGMPGAPPASGMAGAPPTAAQAKQAADLLRNNPDMVKQAAEMMQSMSDEELARMAAMPGAPPGMSPAMMKASIGKGMLLS